MTGFAGLLGLAGVILTGCGEAQPGVAASIDGETLTVEQVQERTAAFFEAYPDFRDQVTADRVTAITVENFIRAQVVAAVAADLDIEPTQGELEAFIEELGGLESVTQQVSGGGVPPFPDLVALEVRSAWIRNALLELKTDELGDQEAAGAAADQTLTEYAQAAEVSVNPRFGTWDGQVVTPANGSLSVVPTEPGSLTGEGALQVPPG